MAHNATKYYSKPDGYVIMGKGTLGCIRHLYGEENTI